jgi:signal transduction histidine kinase
MRSETELRRGALGVFAAVIALTVAYLALSQGLVGRPGLVHANAVDLGDVIGGVAPAAVGLVLAWLRPRNPIGWILLLMGATLALGDAGQAYGERSVGFPGEHLPLGLWTLSLSAPLWIVTAFAPTSLILVRYPSGTITGRWPRRFDRLVIWSYPVVYVGYAASASSVSDEIVGRTPPVMLPATVSDVVLAVGALGVVLGTLLIVGDAIRRVIRSERDERTALALVLITASAAILILLFGQVEWAGSLAYFATLVAIAIGVVRYRALGIELAVRRALVYGLLTGLVLAVFVGVVALVTRVVPGSFAPQVVAAALVAVLLAPARDRVQAVVDRLLYGERNDPVAALRRLSSPIQTASGRVIPAVLASLGQALRLRGVELTDGTSVERWGEVDGDVAVVKLGFAGRDLGELRASPRTGESALGKADRALLQAIAPMVAAIRHATHLTDQLQVEQTRVVKATQSERTRLRHELHDGLGPSLTGIGLGLEAVEQRITDPAARAIVSRLREEVTAALEETRRLIEGLRPAALDNQDLMGALERRAQQASGDSLAVVVRLPAPLPMLPPDVEAAAFRIADEALTNVVRHSHAQLATIEVTADTWLHVSVVDDGIGVAGPRPGGVGLESMRSRAEQVGGRFRIDSRPGRTEVVAELPLEAA